MVAAISPVVMLCRISASRSQQYVDVAGQHGGDEDLSQSVAHAREDGLGYRRELTVVVVRGVADTRSWQLISQWHPYHRTWIGRVRT